MTYLAEVSWAPNYHHIKCLEDKMEQEKHIFRVEEDGRKIVPVRPERRLLMDNRPIYKEFKKQYNKLISNSDESIEAEADPIRRSIQEAVINHLLVKKSENGYRAHYSRNRGSSGPDHYRIVLSRGCDRCGSNDLHPLIIIATTVVIFLFIIFLFQQQGPISGFWIFLIFWMVWLIVDRWLSHRHC